MKYPTVKEVKVKIGSLLRVEDDWLIQAGKFHKKQTNTLLGVVIKMESPSKNSNSTNAPLDYEFVWVHWENGNVTKYLYGDEEVLSL